MLLTVIRVLFCYILSLEFNFFVERLLLNILRFVGKSVISLHIMVQDVSDVLITYKSDYDLKIKPQN